MMQPGGPGWNDPPKLSHQVHSETKTRRNLLNQRVAYLGHTSTPSEKTEILSPNAPPPTEIRPKENVGREITLPKPEVPLNIFVPSSGNSELPEAETNSVEKDTADSVEIIEYEESVDIILKLRSINDQCKNAKNVSATNDVEKKLDILKNMLDEGSLSEPVVTGMRQITFYLLNKQFDKAHDVHVSLMCDHVSEVRLWMVGVKRLINEFKKANSSKET